MLSREQMNKVLDRLKSIGSCEKGLIKLLQLSKTNPKILMLMHKDHIYTKQAVIDRLETKIKRNTDLRIKDVPFLTDELHTISKVSHQFVVVGVNDIVRDVTPADYIDLIGLIDQYNTYHRF